jgi:hypothetical protein
MVDPHVERARRVIALADIAEAVERFQQGEANVDETLEGVAEAMARVAEARREQRRAA